MNDQGTDLALEGAIRAALRASAPADVPLRLEQTVRSIPRAARTGATWWTRIRRVPAALTAAALVVAVAATTLFVLRPGPDGGGPGNRVTIAAPFGSLAATDLALVIDGRRIPIPGPGDPQLQRSTFVGNPTFGQLTIQWRSNDVPYVVVVRFAADARTWWISDAEASDGRTENGGWLYFQGPLLETRRGEAFTGAPVLDSVRSTFGERGSLRVGRLELTAFEGVAARNPVVGPMPATPTIPPDGPDFIPFVPGDAVEGYVSSYGQRGDGIPVVSFRGQAPDIPIFGSDLRTIIRWQGPVGGGPAASVAPSFAPSTAPASVPPLATYPASATSPLPPPDTGTYGRPWTLNGQIVPYNVLRIDQGSQHCDWEDITFLAMGKTLGDASLTADDAYHYVRDPQNRWAREPTPPDEFMTLGRFEPSVRKPDDAVFTGYVYADGMELWRSPTVAIDFVFLRRGDIWEQWPRARSPIGCV